MTIEFLGKPPTIARQGSPRKPDPVVVEFLDALRQNPGKWAEFPLERKTKPQLDDEFEVAGRNGKWYVSYPGDTAEAAEAEDTDVETIDEAVDAQAPAFSAV